MHHLSIDLETYSSVPIAKAAERRIIMAEYHIGCGAFGIYAGTQ